MASRRRRRPSGHGSVEPEIRVVRWGGRREGAGRKPNDPGEPGVSHLRRPSLDGRTPVLITIRVAGVPSLRRQTLMRRIRELFDAGKDRFGFRLCHYSVQDDHIHLLAEPESAKALSRGMQGLSIRLARGINAHLGRSGKVFRDRYFSRRLTTPGQVRRALGYVLNACFGEGATQRRLGQRDDWVDPCSSAVAFDGWSRAVHSPYPRPPPVVQARTWLLAKGWRQSKLGLLEPLSVPRAF